jgi:hypothetical protein
MLDNKKNELTSPVFAHPNHLSNIIRGEKNVYEDLEMCLAIDNHFNGFGRL